MIRIMNDRPTVLVTDCGRGSAIAFIRSLGQRGYRVIASDSEGGSLGFRSRFADRSVVYPNPASQPDEFVSAIVAAVVEHGIDLVIPITDEAILPLSAHRHLLPASCRLAIADPESLAIAVNKQATISLAESIGIPVPKTAIVSTVAEARTAAESMEWPIVVKPRVSRLYKETGGIDLLTVSYAPDLASLEQQIAAYEGRTDVLLQEFVTGSGGGVELLLHEGRPLAAFQHRRLREVPVHGGASSFRESVPLDPVLLDRAVRLMAAMRWTGLAMVEFKGSGESARLMEVNGRVWGSLPLAVKSGMDFPAKLAELLLHGPPPNGAIDTNYRTGVRARNLQLDMVWIGTVLRGKSRHDFLPMPSRGAALAALCGLFRPSNKFDIQSLNDPQPGLAELPKIVGKLLSKMRNDS